MPTGCQDRHGQEDVVDKDMVDDMLLGLNIGKTILAKWLLDPSLTVPIRLTRARSAAEAEEEHADNAELLASGATPYTLIRCSLLTIMKSLFMPLLLLRLMNSCPCLLYLKTPLTEHF